MLRMLAHGRRWAGLAVMFFCGAVTLGCGDDGKPKRASEMAGDAASSSQDAGNPLQSDASAAEPVRTDASAAEPDAGATEEPNVDLWGECVGAKAVPFYTEKACVECMRDNCCEQLTACGDDPTCIGIRECAHSQTCWPEYGEGLGVSSRIGACTARSCSKECGQDQCSGGYLGFLPQACDSCMKSKYCDELQKATDSLAYWDYYRCVVPCETNECATACAQSYPEGYALQHPISVGATTTCSEGCGADYFPPPVEGYEGAGDAGI